MYTSALVAVLFLFALVVDAQPGCKAFKKILDTHPELSRADTRPPPPDHAPRTDSGCRKTNYNLRFWKQKGGTSTKVIGNWHGVGSARIMDKATSTVYVTQDISSIWNATFNTALGHIEWTDITTSGGVTMQPDLFRRYLTNGDNGWYSCSDLSAATTAGSVGLAIDPFGFSTSYDTLSSISTGEQQGACTYHFPSDTVCQVTCGYFDTLGSFVPPGLYAQYYLVMTKDL